MRIALPALVAMVFTISAGFGAMHLAERQRMQLGGKWTLVVKVLVYLCMLAGLAAIGILAFAAWFAANTGGVE